MPKNRFIAEQIVVLLRQIEVSMGQGKSTQIVGQPRGTQRYTGIVRADEDALIQAILALAAQYGRYGYRRITELLKDAGWRVGTDRVQRIWCPEAACG
jgi:putative transposase